MLKRADTKFSLLLLVRAVSLRPGAILSTIIRCLGMTQDYKLDNITQTLKNSLNMVDFEYDF